MEILDNIKKLDTQATTFGFQWSKASEIIDQIISECREIEQELQDSPEKLQEELGDLIHATLSLCLFCGFDPKDTLEKSVLKFQKRFEAVKKITRESGLENLQNQPMEKLMEIWQKAKMD